MSAINTVISEASSTLPSTAIEIKITNVLTPYNIRAYVKENYLENINSIGKKLSLLVPKNIRDGKMRNIEPKLGNKVIVRHNFSADIDIPAWWCRGIICNINPTRNNYDIILIDFGHCIELQREDFIIISSDLIDQKQLSFAISLYNILPASLENLNNEGNKSLVLEEWSESAIEIVKKAIASSDTIYFDCLFIDEYGRKYGEVYLNIEENIVRLRHVLVCNNYAVYLEKELLNFLKNPENYETAIKTTVNHETVFCTDITNEKDAFDKAENERRQISNQQIKDLNIEIEKKRQKILIHGKFKCECLSSVLDVKLPTAIHNVWSTLVRSLRPTKIQSYIWPAIRKGLDVVAIGASKSGKTIGCVVIITGLLATLQDLPGGMNPSALILCSSSMEAFDGTSLCTQFLQNYKGIRCVAAFHGKSEKSVIAEMFNGCQILISTPSYLAHLMEDTGKFLSFKHLRYLVLDNADIILDKYFDSVTQVFKKLKLTRNRKIKADGTVLQVIMTAKHCTPTVKETLSILTKNPYICIASFIEAAIFKGVRPKMYATNSKNKKKLILDLLNDTYVDSRTMVICTTVEEAEELNAFVSLHKNTLLAHENLNLISLQDIRQYWEACIPGFYPLLICTDEVLSDMDITNVEWLIHYSISLESKNQFNFRFSTLLNKLQTGERNCKVTIMADENNDMQFQSILRIMQRMTVTISEDMLKTLELMTATFDKKKKNYPICDKIKAFGFCSVQSSCIYRHCILPEIDAPITAIAINDKVKFMVICIHDDIHLSARIISYVKSDTLEEIKFPNTEYMQLSIQMQNFYCCIENRRRCDVINVGDICTFEESVDNFQRVQVLRIENRRDKKSSSMFADVRCIDTGVIITKVNTYKLLHLPEDLAKISTQVVEVFLVGIAPHDKENSWNHYAKNAVQDWFHRNVNKRTYVIGTVNLHLGNTIWVNTLEIGTELIGHEDLISSSLKMELLEKNCAIPNDNHIHQIYKLCMDAGLKEINGRHLSTLID